MRLLPIVKKWVGLSVAAGLLVGYLLLLFGGLYGAKESHEDPGPAALAFGTGPDLDGDGRPDRIEAGPDGLRMTAATGALLLESDQAVDPAIIVADLEGDYPVVIVQPAPSQYAAYAYAPGQASMQAVTWPDGSKRWRGEIHQYLPFLRLDRLQLHVERD